MSEQSKYSNFYFQISKNCFHFQEMAFSSPCLLSTIMLPFTKQKHKKWEIKVDFDAEITRTIFFRSNWNKNSQQIGKKLTQLSIEPRKKIRILN